MNTEASQFKTSTQAEDLRVMNTRPANPQPPTRNAQQIESAVPLVFKLAPRRSTWRRWLVWCGWLADANAWLLSATEQRALRGWTEQQLDDRHGIRCELWITIIHPRVKDGPIAAVLLEDDADGALAGMAQA